MKLSKLDESIAASYAPTVLEGIKYGENAVLFWFPSSGMATITRDIFNNKSILTYNLQGLSKRLKIIQFWGHLAEKKDVNSFFKESGYSSYSELKDICDTTLKAGKEVVCVIGRIDNFSKKEKLNLLKAFVKLTTINHRRIHIVVNLHDKPGFEELLSENPELMILCNKMTIMPVVQGNLLKNYIKTKSKSYGFTLTNSDFDKAIGTYGGVLRLTKEFLRSKGSVSVLELKLKAVWDSLHKSYQDEIKIAISNKGRIRQTLIQKDLDNFGVTNLKLFEAHQHILNSNPHKAVLSILTSKEQELWKHFLARANSFIDKEQVISILRPDQPEDVSLWALDQAMSRFRKKLAKVGIDSTLLRTIKGKGYIWN